MSARWSVQTATVVICPVLTVRLLRVISPSRSHSSVPCGVARPCFTSPQTIVFGFLIDEKMNRINVQGTVDLIRAAAAAGVSRIVYTSSVATLRLRDDGFPADEESHAELSDMIGAYKQSKFLAEREVKRLVNDAGDPGGHCEAHGAFRAP